MVTVMRSANITAFLSMIAVSEGVENRKDASGNAIDPYRICYAYHHVTQDLTYHPAEFHPDGTREWMGERITQGKYAGELSTAAGRYQITHGTWTLIKQTLSLPDFTGAPQDDGAIYLIEKQGARQLIESGQLEDAIRLLHPIWASLPGSDAGQPITPPAILMAAYLKAGGGLA